MLFYPNNQNEFSDVSQCIDKYFFSKKKISDLLSNGKPVITQGSCFAVNFAKALINKNYPTAHLFVNEWINSTHANAIFFNFITTKDNEKYSPIYENSTYEKEVVDFLKININLENKKEFVKSVKECGIFVLTIGVAPLWVNRESDEYCLAPDKKNINNFRMKTTSIDSNVASIKYVTEKIKEINSKIHIFLTLSPAPLNATNEFDSIFEADCISKSTLRIAIDTVIKEKPEINYWPSFEIVRWLGSHLAPVYATDDDHPRHVSNWLVEIIVEKFINFNGGCFTKKLKARLNKIEVNQPFKLIKNF